MGCACFTRKKRIERVKNQSTNVTRFRIQFGVAPHTACRVYEDLQTTSVDLGDLAFEAGPTGLRFFLMSLYFLRKYPTYDDIEQTFDYSPGYAAKRVWDWIARLRLLKHDKIRLPTEEEMEGDIWIMTVDGTHVWRREKTDDTFAIDRKWWSHKFTPGGALRMRLRFNRSMFLAIWAETI